MKILYCGMQNYGGPGKIGIGIRKLCFESSSEFYWFHNSMHLSPAFNEKTNITLDELLIMEFDVIIHNQWRNKIIYDYFSGKTKQILLIMYEQIPVYWKDFYYSDFNQILSTSSAINDFLDIDVPIINWAVKITSRGWVYKKTKEPQFFFPARDGGEYDRKGIFVLDEALSSLKSMFTINLIIKKDKINFYKKKCKYLFTDSRINIIYNEVSEEEYYKLFIEADALLCPSKTSGIELSLRDAISLNKEVLVTDTLPMNELFNESNAWMIKEIPSKPIVEDNILSVPTFKADALSLATTIDRFILDYFVNQETRIHNISSSRLYQQFEDKLKEELFL